MDVLTYLRRCEYSRRVSTWTASWIVFMTVMGLETKSSTLTMDICGRTICYVNLSLSPRMTKFWFLLTIFYIFKETGDENKPQYQLRDIFLMCHKILKSSITGNVFQPVRRINILNVKILAWKLWARVLSLQTSTNVNSLNIFPQETWDEARATALLWKFCRMMGLSQHLKKSGLSWSTMLL